MGDGRLATRVETRMGAAATERLLDVAHEPWRLEGDRDVVPLGTEKDGAASFAVRVDDDGGWRAVRLRVWRGRGGLAGMADRFRSSTGFQAWANAERLAAAQIPVPRPLLAAERRPGGLEWSCYGCDQVDAAVSLEEVVQQVASWGGARQTKFVRNLALAMRPLKARKLGLAEISPAAFLVRGVPDFEFELLVDDVLGATVGGTLAPAQIESRILFGLDPAVVRSFFQTYGE